jgi:hypothetical protein
MRSSQSHDQNHEFKGLNQVIFILFSFILSIISIDRLSLGSMGVNVINTIEECITLHVRF